MIIGMLDMMDVIARKKKYKQSDRDKYIEKLQQWKKMYDKLGEGYLFTPGYIAYPDN